MYMLAMQEVVKSATKQPAEVPKELQLLFDFGDLIPGELPIELPPMRDIQHAIDLVPGSSLRNLAAYRMNSTEHQELKRQVDEL